MRTSQILKLLIVITMFTVRFISYVYKNINDLQKNMFSYATKLN